MATPSGEPLTQEGAREYVGAFMKILKPEASPYLLTLPRQAVKKEQLQRLQNLVTYLQSLSIEGSEEVTVQAPSTKKRRKHRGPGKPKIEDRRVTQNESFGNIRKILELNLHPVLAKHWDSDRRHEPALPLLCLPRDEWDYGSTVEIIAGYVVCLESVTVPPSVKNLRWLLSLYHLGLHLTDDLGGTDGDISEKTLNDLATAIRARARASVSQDIDNQAIERKIGHDQLLGLLEAAEGVLWFCNKVGTMRSLFYLSGEMNSNFLTNKMTKSGVAYDDMMSHLEKLGLQDAVKAPGVKELGENVSKHLNTLFSIAD